MKHLRQKIPALPAAAAELSERDILLDLLTEGRLWRTSRLLELHLICKEEGELIEEIFVSEKESDEYDILTEAASRLEGPGLLVTYNGDSFDLPHLRKKYQAYGLRIPFDRRTSLDLLRKLRPLLKLLDLPSGKLSDLSALLKGAAISEASEEAGNLPEWANAPENAAGLSRAEESRSLSAEDAAGSLPIASGNAAPLPAEAAPSLQAPKSRPLPMGDAGDARRTLEALALLPVLRFLGGGFRLDRVSEKPYSLIFSLIPADPLPLQLTLSKEGFYLLAAGNEAYLSVPQSGGFARLYFTDTENYEYLPAEGYAVHRSVSAYIAASRKEPASRSTCFTLVPASRLLEDPKSASTFAKSTVHFLSGI